MSQTSPFGDPSTLTQRATLAVLVSGGLDSAILVGESLKSASRVFPLYVRCGMYWEDVEFNHLRQFLEAIQQPKLEPLHVLHVPVADVYGSHWSVTGKDVPDAHSPDEAVFLPGRNIVLLAKALLWCHVRHISGVALGPLSSNPFPDATADFFHKFQAVCNQAVGGNVEVLTPFAGKHKANVMQLGRGLPLDRTFSCIRPVGTWHCGACNKCAERQAAFRDSGLTDPTRYAFAESSI